MTGKLVLTTPTICSASASPGCLLTLLMHCAGRVKPSFSTSMDMQEQKELIQSAFLPGEMLKKKTFLFVAGWRCRSAASPLLFLCGVSFLCAQKTQIALSSVKTRDGNNSNNQESFKKQTRKSLQSFLHEDAKSITLVRDVSTGKLVFLVLSVDLCSLAMLQTMRQSRLFFFSCYDVHIQVNMKSLKDMLTACQS